MIEFMSAPEKTFKPLPVDDDVVFKLIEDTEISVYSGNEIFNPRTTPLGSTKEFVDNLAKYFITRLYPDKVFKEGIEAKILEPGKKWVKGIIRLRLVVEFSPDEPENNGTSNKIVSTLDDIRNIKL